MREEWNVRKYTCTYDGKSICTLLSSPTAPGKMPLYHATCMLEVVRNGRDGKKTISSVKKNCTRGSSSNGEIQCSTQCTQCSLIYRHVIKTGNSRLDGTSLLKVGLGSICLVAVLAPLVVSIVEFLQCQLSSVWAVDISLYILWEE